MNRSHRTGRADSKLISVVLLICLATGPVIWWTISVFSGGDDREVPAEPLRVMPSDAETLTALDVAQNGEALATSSADGEVLVWRLPSRRLNVVGTATGLPGTMLKWSPDGLLISGDSSGLLRSWKPPEFQQSRIDSPRVAVTSCAFRQELAERQILLGLSDGRIVTVTPQETTLRDSGHRSVKAMLISSDQKILITAGSEGTVRWYDFQREEVTGTASGHETEIAAIGMSSDDTQVVSADWNGELRIWDARKRNLVTSASQPDAVSTLVWTNQRIITGSWDGRIRIWNVESNQLQLSASIYTGQPVHDLAVESSGETAFTVSGDGNVREWSLK